MPYEGTRLQFDISELSNGIKQANQLIKTNESAWRAHAAELGAAVNSIDGLSDRNEHLQKQLEQQGIAIVNQEEIVKRYSEVFGESSAETLKEVQSLNNLNAQYSKTRAEIEKNTAKIDSLTEKEREAGKTSAELAKDIESNVAARRDLQRSIAETESKIDSLTSAEGDHADEIRDLRKQLAEEKKALTAAGGAVNDAADEVEDLTDEVEDLADETGKASGKSELFAKSLNGLAGMGKIAAAGLAGVAASVGGAVAGMTAIASSTEESRASFARLENNAALAGKSYESLTADLKDVVAVTGDLEAGMEGFNMLANLKGTDKEISKISNALAGAAAKFDGLKFEGLAEGLQETLATGAAVGPFAELIERTGGDLEAFNSQLESAGDEAGRTQIALQWLADSGLGSVADSYREANKEITEARQAEIDLQLATNALGEITAPLANKIKSLSAEFVSSLVPGLQGAATAFNDLINGVAGADKDLAYNLGYLIGSATRTVKGWWNTARPALETMFTEVLPAIGSKIISAVPGLISGIATAIGEHAPAVLAQATGLLNDLVSGFKTYGPVILADVSKMLMDIAGAIAGAVPEVVAAGITLLSGLIDSIIAVSKTVLDNMPTLIASVVDGLGNGALEVLNGAGELFDQIIAAIPGFLENLKTNLPQIIETIINKIAEWLPKIAAAGVDLFNKIVDAIPGLLVTLATELPQIITKITVTLLEGLPKIFQMGKDLFGEIINAIPGTIADLGRELPAIVTAIVDGLGAGMGEIYDIGVNILKGVWNGINDTVAWLSDKIGSIFGKDGVIVGGIKKLLGIHSPSTVGAELGDYFMQGFNDGMEGRSRETTQIVKDTMTGVVTTAKQALKDATGNAAGAGGTGIGGEAADALTSSFSGFDKKLQDLLGSALESAITGDSGPIKSGLNGVADFMVGGLQSYVTAALPGFGGFLAGAIGGIWRGIKTLFKGEADKSAQEMTEDQLRYARDLAAAQSEAYVKSFKTARAGMSYNLGTGIRSTAGELVTGGAKAGKVVNYTQNNYSPKALSAKEIYRQNNRAINLLAQGAAV